MKIFVLLFCCALAVKVDAHNNTNPVVYSLAGIFKGSILKSQLGKDIYSFRGIRYADAPTGKNRFKQATLTKPFRGIFDATEDGPSCPQPVIGNRIISEDCLRLNVYTTTLPEISLSFYQKPKPVIVFFHPGAFYAFSGSSWDYGPQIMLDRDIILVTLNYRLGALGFLNTGDKHAPGNAGFKDQVLALRWIKQNIRHFGGDPNRVTLTGHTAGATCVTLHMVSPMSKGLFHRAVVMSGAITSQNSLPTNQTHIAKQQAKILGCPTDTLDNMFDCLYTKSPQEYSDSFTELSKSFEYPFSVWSPVVETLNHVKNNHEESFLTSQPVDIIRSGKANFVPLIVGSNKNEFEYLVIPAEEQAQRGNTTLYDEWNNKWEELAPRRFEYEIGTPRSLQISKELKSFYLNDKPLKAGRYHGLAKLYADSLTIYQVHRFERLMATYSTESTWYYQHVYSGCETFVKWSNGTRFGIIHQDELFLLFKVRDRPTPCKKDLKVIENITGIFEHFAKTGKPLPDNSELKWEPSTENRPIHEETGEEMKVVLGSIYPERMNKWDELFPLPPIEH